MRDKLQEFAANGFLVIPDALSDADVAHLNRAFDEELVERPEMWIPKTPGRLDNPNVLLASDAFDRAIFNARMLRVVMTLMGDDTCLDEFFLMIRAPRDEPGDPSLWHWHRDMPHDPGHPLALAYLSVMYYLTDVDETTHCFAIAPEGVARKRTCPKDTDGSNGREIYGRAGTAIVFNAGSCHTAIIRQTTKERRTAQVYFGQRSQLCISNDTILPGRFFRSRKPCVKALCYRTNDVTQLVREHC
jgi:hypothetical protein